MNTTSSWKRVTIWTGTLIVAAVFLTLLVVGLQPQSAAAQEFPPIYISTWGNGTISQTQPPRSASEIITYTAADILKYEDGRWTKWFDAAAAGLNPRKVFPHNITAIWISDTVAWRDDGQGQFIAAFRQNRRQGIPGIDGFVDGYDLVYYDGYSFTLWFDGEDVGLTNKTQEKIDSLTVLSLQDQKPTPPPARAGDPAPCQALVLISTFGSGSVPSAGPGSPAIKFHGEDVLAFCATNLGTNTAGYWQLVMDGSEALPPLRRGDVDSISGSNLEWLYYGTAHKRLPYHSMVFGYDYTDHEVFGPMLDFADLGITSPVDALHIAGTLYD